MNVILNEMVDDSGALLDGSVDCPDFSPDGHFSNSMDSIFEVFDSFNSIPDSRKWSIPGSILTPSDLSAFFFL